MDALIYWWFVEPVAVIAAIYVLIWLGSRLVKQRIPAIWLVPVGFVVGLVIWHYLPEWDTVEGERLHAELCAKEAGVKVYKPVYLSEEQFGPDGLPVFYIKAEEFFSKAEEWRPGKWLREPYAKKYSYQYKSEHVWRPDFATASITKDIVRIYASEGNILLGESIAFQFQPGGPPKIILVPKSRRCEGHEKVADFREQLIQAVFQRVRPMKGGSQ